MSENNRSLQKIARYKGKAVTVRELHRLQKRADKEVLRQFYASFRRKK
jgi:hypothetical protein